MARRRFLNAKDINEIIENWSDEEEMVESVVVFPPDKVDALTDEEDIDEDDLPALAPDGIPEVSGTVDMEFQSNKHDFAAPEGETLASEMCCAVIEGEGGSVEIENIPYKKLSEFGTPNWSKGRKTSENVVKYTSSPTLANLEPKVAEVASLLENCSPLELFQKFYNNEILQLILEESNRYYNQNNNSGEVCTLAELNRFLGILIMSGYSTCPSTKDYWSTKPTLGRQIVKNAMSRNRFTHIKRYLHLQDNNHLDVSDRFAKLKSYFDILNKNFNQFGNFSSRLFIDEQMVPYFGKHSCKMYIRNKPIRFGYKIWCLCSSEGYLYQFLPYSGAAGGFDKQIGLGADVVLKLLSFVENPECHEVYFDNFFTSYYLMCLLSERHFFATGTVRVNRLNGAILKTGKALPKGETDYVFDKRNEILIARWSDNKEVTLVSNHQPLEPFEKASRYDKTIKKKVSVNIGSLIYSYKYMGGVDLHDNAVPNYRISIRGKKWWWPLFVSGIDSAMANAWKLHCIVAKHFNRKAMTQIQFRIEITEQLLVMMDDKPLKDIAEAPIPNLSGDHLIIKADKVLRCKVCHKTTYYKCSACQKHLHVHCFSLFELHKKK